MPSSAQKATVTSLADLRQVRGMLADAEPVPVVRNLDPVLGDPVNGVPPGGWRENPSPLGLPRDCPVRPLGVSGKRLWFLNTIDQLDYLDPQYTKSDILQLFGGRYAYLCWAWPRFSDTGKVTNFDNMTATADLIAACKALGPWEASDKERWQGCWRDLGGNLVVHCGNVLYMGGKKQPPGEYEGFVYPARPKLLQPWPLKDDDVPSGFIRLLRGTLDSWNWNRPGIDPHLMLGWIGCAFLGGALPWRPMIYLTGGAGTGKSSLQQLLRSILGDWVFHTEDTTRAGISQPLGMSSIAVSVDELEGESDPRRGMEILKLARVSASGGRTTRGGDQHKGAQFTTRSSFIFSSINAPPMQPQDLSRMALLQLKQLTAGQAAPVVDSRSNALFGRYILRRLIEEWPRFDATAAAFAEELAKAGMNQRGQAQFGTLLAVADMMEHTGWDEARLAFAHEHEGELRPWHELLAISGMTEFEDSRDNWMGCLSHLLAVRVDAWKGGVRHTVGHVLQAYWDQDIDATTANTALAQAGLRIVFKKFGRGAVAPYLAVHNNGPLVRQLFEGSTWAGVYGAGLWKDALRQGAQGALWEMGQCRVNGVQAKATLLSLVGLYGDGGVMAETKDEE